DLVAGPGGDGRLGRGGRSSAVRAVRVRRAAPFSLFGGGDERSGARVGAGRSGARADRVRRVPAYEGHRRVGARRRAAPRTRELATHVRATGRSDAEDALLTPGHAQPRPSAWIFVSAPQRRYASTASSWKRRARSRFSWALACSDARSRAIASRF